MRPQKPIVPDDADAKNLLQRPQSLSDAAYDAILQKLFSLEIGPEERISVSDLEKKLGVSQTPIREALTRLEGQGLIQKTHLVGYRASPQLSREEFNQFYDARMLLEPYVAAQAATLIDSASLQRLKELLDDLDDIPAHDVRQAVRFSRADSQFHRIIAASSGNLVIARTLDTVQIRVQFTLIRHRAKLLDARPAAAEHRSILSALNKRDGDLAAAQMRTHIANSRQRYWPQNEQ